jgi:hypothetical protein
MCQFVGADGRKLIIIQNGESRIADPQPPLENKGKSIGHGQGNLIDTAGLEARLLGGTLYDSSEPFPRGTNDPQAAQQDD